MKSKLILLLFIFIQGVVCASEPDSDTSYWKSKYESSLGFSQTALVNWVKGGEKSSFSSYMILNLYENYAKKNVTWNNYVGIAYGISKVQSIKKLRKNEDKFNVVSKAGLKAWHHWEYSGLFDFKSQFAEGFSYPNDSVHISRFLAPGYLQLSVGMNYKPTDYFSVFISPVGARLTIVNDTSLTNRKEGAYGIFAGESTLWQVGGSVNAVFKKDIMKNINLMSKLDIFTNYSEKPDMIVVGWENNLLMKVNKYISVTISTMFIYDEKAIPRTDDNSFKDIIQFKETFGVGLAYSIFN